MTNELELVLIAVGKEVIIQIIYDHLVMLIVLEMGLEHQHQVVLLPGP